MPISEAVDLVLAHGIAIGFARRRESERQAFTAIHRLATQGKIRMAGCIFPDKLPPKRIQAKAMKTLTANDVLIPRSERAPEGWVYGLVSEDPARIYVSLLVDRTDLYKHWPKTGPVGASRPARA